MEKKKVKVQTGNIGYLQEHSSARKWKQKAHKLKYIYTTHNQNHHNKPMDPLRQWKTKGQTVRSN